MAESISPTEAAVDKAVKEAKAADAQEAAAPGLDVKVPEAFAHKGAWSAEGETPFEGVVLAFRQLDLIAEAIAKRVRARKPKPKAVLIHNPADLQSRKALEAFEGQRALFVSEFGRLAEDARKLLEPPEDTAFAPPVLPVVGSVLTAGLQLLSLFKVDHKLRYGKVDIPDRVLVTAVSGLLVTDIPVYDTAMMPIPSKPPGEGSVVWTKLRNLRKGRADLVGWGDRLHVTAAPDPKPDAKPDEGPAADPAKAVKAALHAQIVAAIAAFDAFEASLAKVDEKSGLSTLSRILDGEALGELLGMEGVVLWLEVVASGGGSHARESGFDGSLTFSGGAVAAYAIYAPDGKLLEANTAPAYSGFVSEGDLPAGRLHPQPTWWSAREG